MLYERRRNVHGMKRLWMLCSLCALTLLPAAAFAQEGPPGMGGPPSPQQQAAMEKIRTDAKAAAYAALSPAHAASVNAIVAQVAAGTLDRRAAGGQIDALLTPDEAKGVLAAAAKSRDAMRAAMGGAAGPPPGGPPPGAGAPPPAGGPPPGGPPGGGRFGPPTAGRFLLMISMSPRQMRRTQPRDRSGAAQ
jgi:hypothetical protein